MNLDRTLRRVLRCISPSGHLAVWRSSCHLSLRNRVHRNLMMNHRGRCPLARIIHTWRKVLEQYSFPRAYRSTGMHYYPSCMRRRVGNLRILTGRSIVQLLRNISLLHYSSYRSRVAWPHKIKPVCSLWFLGRMQVKYPPLFSATGIRSHDQQFSSYVCSSTDGVRVF